jgi:hypothetical protein
MSVAVRRGRSSVHVGCTPDSDRKFDERVPVEKGQMQTTCARFTRTCNGCNIIQETPAELRNHERE